jgi:hypothetical protein
MIRRQRGRGRRESTINIICAVCLDNSLDFVTLAIIGGIVIVGIGIVAEVDRHVHLGLPDGLELRRVQLVRFRDDACTYHEGALITV